MGGGEGARVEGFEREVGAGLNRWEVLLFDEDTWTLLDICYIALFLVWICCSMRTTANDGHAD